jgi:ABC-type nitrate/sulfonate/bicarbonate transport system ATPase subunit
MDDPATVGKGCEQVAQMSLSIDIRRKDFGPAIVLEKIAFTAKLGERIALLGPSGVGKSTLLSLIAGLDTDYDGTITSAGRTAMIFQAPRLLPWRSLIQNLLIAVPDATEQEARAALDEVGLRDAADQHPEKVSLGMQRRAALARALLAKPNLLLMDEPLVSLDVEAAKAMRALLLKTLNLTGATALIATHDRREALFLADRVLEIGGAPATLIRDRATGLPDGEQRNADMIETLHKEWFE